MNQLTEPSPRSRGCLVIGQELVDVLNAGKLPAKLMPVPVEEAFVPPKQ